MNDFRISPPLPLHKFPFNDRNGLQKQKAPELAATVLVHHHLHRHIHGQRTANRLPTSPLARTKSQDTLSVSLARMDTKGLRALREWRLTETARKRERGVGGVTWLSLGSHVTVSLSSHQHFHLYRRWISLIRRERERKEEAKITKPPLNFPP